PDQSWLVTFGDLLTLLLCLFLSIFAFSRHASTSSAPGTDLANTTLKKGTIVVSFADDELKKMNQAALPIEIERRLGSQKYSVSRMILSTCSSIPESSDSEHWFQSLQSALEVKRQVIDGNFEGAELKIEP